ncbi:MAG: protein translocase subunit SecD [Acidimicrobiales bacterium]
MAAGWAPKLGLDLDGGLEVVYQTHRVVTQSELNTVATVLGERVNAGVSGASVATQGSNQIAVQIPGEKNAQQVLSTLGNTAQLFFRPALCGAPQFAISKGTAPSTGPLPQCSSASELTASSLAVNTSTGQATGNPPEDAQLASYKSTPSTNDDRNDTVLLPGAQGSGISGRYVLGPAGMSGAGVKSASAQVNNGIWVVNLTLTSVGASQWDTLARQQFHAIIGIDLDAQVISAPITLPSQASFTSFNGNVQISGNFTETEAKTLATQLTYGALPVKLDRLTVETVSPTLGKASLQAGLISGLVGLVLVMLYVILYYRMLGFVVVAGLLLTGGLLWSIIAFLGEAANVTLNLAGVIGIIVSIGITVDSYIVYFERLKDEARSGRTIRTSVERGFRSAFRTVLAADAVSLLGAVILYLLSIGDVQGFALFLGISTALDIFVTYFFTRPVVVLLGRSRSGSADAQIMSVASGLGVKRETEPVAHGVDPGA